MEESKRFYKVKLVWNRIRHGLFLFTLRNVVKRIGLDIEPYYLYKEIKSATEEPKIQDSYKDYELCYIGIDYVDTMMKITGLTANELKHYLATRRKCIGLKRGKAIVSLLFVDMEDFKFKGRSFKLKDKEGYLLDLYTFHSHRGKNLATYLRYHCFELLENHNIEELLSIVSYFNTSSIKVSRKLNAQKLKLYLYIGLLRKYHWNFQLKNYSI